MSQVQLEMHMGWKHGTRMSATYLHLRGGQVDNTILEHYGLKQKKEKASELIPRKCPRCKTTNGPTSDFCASCGMVLNLETAVDVEKKRSDIAMAQMELVEKEPEIAKILRESVRHSLCFYSNFNVVRGTIYQALSRTLLQSSDKRSACCNTN
jgi:hypothetical protein